MSTTELTTRFAGTGEKLQHLAGAAFVRIAALWRAARNRRSVAKLLDWDDRMLRDIGLTQSDVRAAMAAPAGDDPSNRLAGFSAERRLALKAQAEERSIRRVRRKTPRRELPSRSYPILDL